MNEPSDRRLTIAALAWNEARHLGPCFHSLEQLKALTGADTLIILNADAGPVTAQVAHAVADRVATSVFVNFSAQRNRALDLADGKWVFFIDPDERCTPTLADEIAGAISVDSCAAFGVPRRNFFFGHEVRHTGWSPDFQIRLLQRERCRFDESREVHEVPVVDGDIGYLSAPLIHFNYDRWSQFFAKQGSYARLEARALYRAGTRARPRSLLGQPIREFKRRFVDYRGYKDGLLGLALSVAMAGYTFETYRRLLRLRRQGSR